MTSGALGVPWTLLLLGLVALVYAPLRSAMPVGDDPRVLAASAELDEALRGRAALEPAQERAAGRPALAALKALEVEGPGPLGSLSLALTSRLWRGEGTWNGTALTLLRLENLLLLLVAALGLGLFLRRLLEPWTSAEHARAAGLAATFLFALHPLAPAAVAAPAARGDLLVLALLLGGAALFLKGRQERRGRLVLAAGAAVLLAGLTSELALLAAPPLAAAEWASARRARPAALRRRTALSTLVLFGALSASGILLANLVGLAPGPRRLLAGLALFDEWSDLPAAMALWLERFGLLLFPINARGTGLFDFVALGMLLMVVLHPALSAARAAPRLWGTVLVAWFAGMVLAQLPAATLRVHPNDWTHARQLTAGAVVMAAGLAVAATAVSGKRRVAIPVLVVLGLGLLARADADCLNRAGRPARRLQQDLLAALERFPLARSFLVVEPPGLVRAHSSVSPQLGWLVHRSLVGSRAPRGGTEFRGLEAQALLEYLRQPEAQLRRAAGLVIDLPLSAFGLERPPSERLTLRLPPASGVEGPRAWGGEGASPRLDLDPFEAGSLIAVPPPERPGYLPPLVRWRAGLDDRLPTGMQGTWIVGASGRHAVFDLDRSLAWLLGGTVERVWLEGGVAEPQEARLEQGLPPLLGAERPLRRGGDWVFALAPEALTLLDEDQAFVLALLDLASLRRVELRAYLDGRGELVAEDVEPLLRRFRRAGGELCWTLEHRAAGRAVARSTGRL